MMWDSLGPGGVRCCCWNRTVKACHKKSLPPKKQVLTAGEKPEVPTWSGIGDFDVVKETEVEIIINLFKTYLNCSLNNVQCSVLQLVSTSSTGRCGTGKPSVGSWLPPISGDHQSGPNINKCSVNCISFYSFWVIFSCSMYILIAMQWIDKSQRSCRHFIPELLSPMTEEVSVIGKGSYD